MAIVRLRSLFFSRNFFNLTGNQARKSDLAHPVRLSSRFEIWFGLAPDCHAKIEQGTGEGLILPFVVAQAFPAGRDGQPVEIGELPADQLARGRQRLSLFEDVARGRGCQ